MILDKLQNNWYWLAAYPYYYARRIWSTADKLRTLKDSDYFEVGITCERCFFQKTFVPVVTL